MRSRGQTSWKATRTFGRRCAAFEVERRRRSDKDWVDAVAWADKLESDEDFRQAMCSLRGRAKTAFGLMLRTALKQYAQEHGDMLPTDISQLQAYLNEPVEDSLLARYQLTQTGRLGDLTK